jgi:hypothetical protein
VITGNAAGPTPICNTLSTATWDATGNPFNLCASGATIPFGVTITIDGSKGQVQVHSAGGGLNVNGGVLQTINTTSTSNAIFDASPSTTPGAWSGLTFTADGSANKGSGTLANVNLSYASTGITVNSGATSLAGGWGISLTNVAIDHTSSHGLYVTYTPVTVSSGTFTSIGGYGVIFYGSSGQKLSVDGSTFSTVGNQAISASAAAGVPVTVTNNTISAVGTSSSGSPAIEVDNSDIVTVSGNQITGSGLGSDTNHTKNPVILLGNDTMNLGSVTGQPSVFGNNGNGNGLDAMQLNGVTVKNNFNWITPHVNATSATALGYLLGSDLTVAATGTMTVAANDVIKAVNATIRLTGSHLVVNGSAGNQAVFTSMKDSSFDSTRTLPTTCPSSLVSTCVATAGDWGGISVTGTGGDATLAFATIRYPGTGINITSGATSLAGGYGLALSNSVIDHTSSSAVSATYTAATLSSSNFSSIGAYGVYFYATTAGQKLNIDSITFATITYQAINASMQPGLSTVVTNNTVSGSGTYGTGYPAIEVDNTDTLTLSGNRVTGSSRGTDVNQTRNPAILLSSDAVNLGSVTGQPSVFNNTGNTNALDALALSGVTVKNSFSWQTPHVNVNATDALGYLLSGDLTIAPGATMSLATNDVVKAVNGTIRLNGAHLVVSGVAGNQAVFTSFRDSSFDVSKSLPSTCPSWITPVCVAGPNDWGGVNVNTTLGTAGDASLMYATIRYASNGIAISSSATSLAGGWGLIASNVTLDHIGGTGIASSYTATSVTGGTLSNIGAHGIQLYGSAAAHKLTVDTTTFTTVNWSAILANATTAMPVTITNNTISAAGTYSSGYPAIEVDSADTLTLSGNTVTGSSAGTGATNGVKNPAILFSSDTVNLGSVTGQPSVFGNNGNGNGLDAMQLNGVTVRNTFSWQTPHPNVNPTDPLGYLVTSSLTLSPNQTMTVGADDVVKILSGAIAVNGAHLVVNGTAGHQAIFTSMRDGSFDAGHNVTVTCPSSIVAGCVATPSDWYGISVTQGTALGIPYLGDLAMTQSTIRYANAGISINSGATSLAGGWGASLTGVTIDHINSTAIAASYTPLTVSGSTLTNIGSDGVNFYGSDKTKHKLSVDTVTFTTVGGHGIYAYAAAGIPVVITSNTISTAATNSYGNQAIEVDSTDMLTLSNNRVTASSLGSNGTKNSPIVLSADTVNLGSVSGQPSVFGNTGSGNALDVIQMSAVTVKNSFSWQTPHVNANPSDPLGYVLTSDLTVAPNQTMTVAADDVIKVLNGTIRLSGAHLVVNGTAGHQAVFTSLRDGSFDSGRNVPSTCPTAMVSDCVAGAGNWGGLSVTAGTDSGLPYLGDAAIAQAAIRYAGTAVSINDGASSLPGGWGLTLANVAIDHMSGDGVGGSYTPVSVTGSSISAVGSTGVHIYISVAAQKLTVDSTSFNTSGYHAILVQAVSGVPIALTNNTIVAAGTTTASGSSAIEVDSADNLALNGNKVSGSGTGQNGTKNPAIRLISDTVNLSNVSGQPSVYNNTGNGNGLDAFELNSVSDKSSFAWQTPRPNSADTDPIGYLINSDLSVGPNATLTFAANDVVKALSGGIKLNGSHLVETASGSVFTSIRDGSVDAAKNVLTACPSAIVPLCVPQPGDWGGITIGAGTAGGVPVQGDGVIVGAMVRYAGNGVTLSSTSTALSGGVGLQMSKSVVQDSSTQGVAVSPGASATISTSRFSNNGGTSTGAFAITANGPVAVDCSSIHGNSQGFYSGGAGNSIAQSDLFGNTGANRYDVFAYYATAATNNWWGQNAGPIAGQTAGSGAIDSSSPLPSQAPTATITLSGDNTNANGALGTGTLTVTVTFSRKMDTSVQPTVTIDPGGHAVVGDWRPDGKTWVGTYVMTSSTTSAGQNTVNVSGARSCVPEPTTNQMAAQQKTFTADFGLATPTTNAATLITDQGATLNGTANPNGWTASAYFEYGTTSGTYPSTTPTQNIGNGTSAVAVQQAVIGLTPFTTYYYKTVAMTANGVAEGNEQTFVTPSILHFPALMNNAFGNPGYTTTIYLQNKSGAALAANAITITYYDQNGGGVGAGDSSPALVDGAVWVIPQSNGHSFPSGGAGSGRVNTSVPLVAFVNQEIPGGDGSGYSALPDPATGPTVYAPTILNNAYGGYTTSLGITNTGTGTTTVSVTYDKLDGTAIVGPTKSLAPNAFWGLYQGEAGTPLAAGFAGTATVSTNPPSSLAVIVNEINSQNGQFLTYTASNTGARTLFAPVILNNAYGGYSTAIGLQNLGSGTAHVAVTYTGAPGTCTVTGPFCEVFTMNAGGSKGLYNGGGSSNPALTSGFAGSAVIVSDQPLISIVNQVKGGANFGTSYNTFAGGVPTVNLPLVENNYNGFSTGVGIENVGTGSATVAIVYRNVDTGVVVGSGATMTLLPGQYAGVYQGPGGDGGVPAGTRATAKLTITNPGGGGKLAVIANQQSATSFMSYSGQ